MNWSRWFVLTIAILIQLKNSYSYRICVMDEALQSCLNMVADTASLNLGYECVRARDRLECMKMIQNGMADFAPFEPEDMYIAAKFLDDSLAVFLEARTAPAQLDMFRTFAVAVVRNDANINYSGDLRGKISCHGGYGRVLGWHIPVHKLMGDLYIRPDCSGEQPSVEHEIAAVSRFFHRACIPGKWTPDEATDRLFKQRYWNLCSACRDPVRCSDSDAYSGNEGALRCVLQGVGQVAWTSYATVRTFFGFDAGTPAAEIVNYSFLCPDGGRRPLTSPFPCVWAGRPWNGYMARRTNSMVVLRDMQQRIARAVEVARAGGNNARFTDWLTRVLGFEPDSVPFAFDELSLVTASDYLSRANYTMTIEGRGCRGRPLRFCVVSDKEQQKCQDLRMAALSRRVLPEIGCVRGSSVIDCMDRIRRGEVEVRNFDSADAFKAGRTYGLKPLVSEAYAGLQDASSYAVAVVKANSGINRLEDLRDKRSCHSGYGRVIGWNIPVYMLSEKRHIYPERCRFGRAVGQFFRQSCAAGAKEFANDVFRDNPDALCALCAGQGGFGGLGRCSSNPFEEIFAGFRGAFHCLVEGGGDVAFVRHTTPFEHTDGNNLIDSWAIGLSSNNFRLLCKDGGVRTIDEFATCNLGKVPPPMVMTDGWKTAERSEEMRIALLKLSELFSPSSGGQVIFRLFGPYDGFRDLMFRDIADHLSDLGQVDYIEALSADFVRMMDQTTCGAASIHPIFGIAVPVLAMFLTKLLR